MESFDRRSPAPELGDPQTLVSILDDLDEQGYCGQFGVREDATVSCLTCRRTYPAGELRVETLRRLEGASDPDDMLVVAPVVCPRCEAQGSLVLNYGPEASPEESLVLLALAEPR